MSMQKRVFLHPRYPVSVPESTFFRSDGTDVRVRAPVHEETDDEERCGFDGR